VKAIGPEKVFCVHGKEEYCEAFAKNLKEEGFDAVAPEHGDSFEI